MIGDDSLVIRRKAGALTKSGITAPRLLVLGALGVLLYFAHVAFIPIALALLFALVLSSPVEALQRRGLPRGVGALILLAVALGIIIGSMAVLWTPAQYWYEEAPRTIRTIRHKFAPAVRIVSRVDDLGSSAGILSSSAAARPGTPGAPPPVVAVPSSENTTALLGTSVGAAVSSLTFVILTLFLLTGGPPMMARMTAAFVSDLKASHVQKVIEAVRAEVARFYVVTAVINLGLGAVTTVAMMLWGMPTPYVWGILAALLNFIPYAGPATTWGIITFVAAMTFDKAGPVIGVAGTFLVITTIEGQVVQPLFVGRRLEINPLLIFLGLWLGGLFWGVAGVLLATPVLVALKVIAQHSAGGQSVLEFLGPNDQSNDDNPPLQKLIRVWSADRLPDG